jgi:ABC-2 type transport system ATP-binding protein
MSKVMIKVSDVTKSFKLPHEKQSSLKSKLIHLGKQGYETQHALRGISFEVYEGEFFGIVGRNGSGKSTLLKMLAGIYEPTSGSIDIEGRLTPFIELGVGFNPELSGRDNVYLNGALLGFTRSEMEAMYESIVEFAEIERFMDQKLKNYSSGMQVRLAFAIAVRARSDILLLDEVLAVGDADFQKKCFDYFRDLKRQGQTVVFVSHDMNAVREYCDRAILIDNGKIIKQGSTDKVAEAYIRLFSAADPKESKNAQDKRWGTNQATIKKIKTVVEDKELTITVDCEVKADIEDPIMGLTIHNPVGVKVFESNTKWKHYETKRFKKGDTFTVIWKIANTFTNGVHYISPAIANQDGNDFYDNWEEAATFDIKKDEVTTALVLSESSVSIKR